MMYLFALIIASSIGILTIRLITKNRCPSELSLFLGSALGLGIASQIIFYLQLIGQNFNHFLPVLVSFVLLGTLLCLNKNSDRHYFYATNQKWCLSLFLSLFLIPILAIPLWFEANHYPLGGWDAWSCWNLKAKFIYFGEHHWKDMFDPVLWRSNTGYPLALPSIHVWFWQWTGFSQNVTMFNAILITLLTAGILLLGLQALKVPSIYATMITLAVFTLGFGNTLCISQYSDILFSLYLLCAFVCFFSYEQFKDKSFLLIMAIFIGLLSFTKNEGLAACGILTLLVLAKRPNKPWIFTSVLFLATLPTILFTFSIAPHGGVFINGLVSSDHPSSFSRFLYIVANIFSEFISLKWVGLWILVAVGLILSKDKAFKKPLVIVGTFVAWFLVIIMAYYQINTFFDNIGWWMDNTLNRIVFALMPSVFLWMGLSVFKKDA